MATERGDRLTSPFKRNKATTRRYRSLAVGASERSGSYSEISALNASILRIFCAGQTVYLIEGIAFV